MPINQYLDGVKLWKHVNVHNGIYILPTYQLVFPPRWFLNHQTQYLQFVSLDQASRCSEQGATPNQSAEALKSKARKREVPAPMPALAWGLLEWDINVRYGWGWVWLLAWAVLVFFRQNVGSSTLELYLRGEAIAISPPPGPADSSGFWKTLGNVIRRDGGPRSHCAGRCLVFMDLMHQMAKEDTLHIVRPLLQEPLAACEHLQGPLEVHN